MDVPPEIPVIIPVVAPTVATAGVLLLQVPPVISSVNVIVEPEQIMLSSRYWISLNTGGPTVKLYVTKHPDKIL